MGFDPSMIMNPEFAENFLCTICFEVSQDPTKCTRCSKMFCAKCIAEWKNVRSQCPFKCSEEEIIIIELEGDEIQEYYKIQVKCNKKCETVVPLEMLNDHLSVCGLGFCENHKLCSSHAKFEFSKRKFCSQACYNFIQMKDDDVRNQKAIFHFIRSFKLNKNKMKLDFLREENDYFQEGYVLEESVIFIKIY